MHWRLLPFNSCVFGADLSFIIDRQKVLCSCPMGMDQLIYLNASTSLCSDGALWPKTMKVLKLLLGRLFTQTCALSLARTFCMFSCTCTKPRRRALSLKGRFGAAVAVGHPATKALHSPAPVAPNEGRFLVHIQAPLLEIRRH